MYLKYYNLRNERGLTWTETTELYNEENNKQVKVNTFRGRAIRAYKNSLKENSEELTSEELTDEELGKLTQEINYDSYQEFVKLREKEDLTWDETTEKFNKKYQTNLTKNQFVYRATKNKEQAIKEYEKHYDSGIIEVQQVVQLSREYKDHPEKMLDVLGYNPENWELVKLDTSIWEAHTKEQDTKQLHAVKFQIKPLTHRFTKEELVEIAEEIMQTKLKPLNLPDKVKTTDGNNLLVYCPAIELHLGKLAHHIDTGENYDHKIAAERFVEIMESLRDYIRLTGANNLLISIGGDFFNSDTFENTTTAGTPQHNDMRYQKLFLTGLKLYVEALLMLREKVDNIKINLVPGNHDRTTSFYLFVTLSQYFRNDNVIEFSSDFKAMQAHEFGNSGLFMHHGDVKGKNYESLVSTISDEFREIWGRVKHTELYLGHLHTEQKWQQLYDERPGTIVRRVGSPTGTDAYHYHNRYIGNRKAHQFFLHHFEKGMINSQYVVFSPQKEEDISLKHLR